MKKRSRITIGIMISIPRENNKTQKPQF